MWKFIIKHWRGELGLRASALLGLLAPIPMRIVAAIVAISLVMLVIGFGGPAANMLLARKHLAYTSSYTMMGILAIEGIWLIVGIFRSGTRNAANESNTKSQRLAGVATAAWAVVIALAGAGWVVTLGETLQDTIETFFK
jgi:hypothetical protein